MKDHASAGQCCYCGHCGPCMAGIDIAAVLKLADLAADYDEPPANLTAQYFALDKNASDCVDCRKCDTRCDNGVLVSARMATIRLLFEW